MTKILRLQIISKVLDLVAPKPVQITLNNFRSCEPWILCDTDRFTRQIKKSSSFQAMNETIVLSTYFISDDKTEHAGESTPITLKLLSGQFLNQV